MKRLLVLLSLVVWTNTFCVVKFPKRRGEIVVGQNLANDPNAAHHHSLHLSGFGRAHIEELRDDPEGFDWDIFPAYAVAAYHALRDNNPNWLEAYDSWLNQVEQQEQGQI